MARLARIGLTVVTAIAFIALAAANVAHAADAPPSPPVYKALPPVSPAWSWTGLYVGGHFGGGPGKNAISDPYGSAIFGDTIRTPGFMAGGQVGYNYQLGPMVLGVEADSSWANSDGTNTCFGISGYFISTNCHAHSNWLATATARLGWAFGPSGRTIVYGKGGVAWSGDEVDFIVNDNPAARNFMASSSFTKSGWTIGAGAEHALDSRWSVKIEYDYLKFGADNVPTPSVGVPFTLCTPPPGFCLGTPVGRTNGQAAGDSSNIHELKLGLNYRLGEDSSPPWSPSASLIGKAAWAPGIGGWELDTGGRYWYSSGRFQKDFGAGPVAGVFAPGVLISRLTYDDMKSSSGELFARVDSPWNIFVKGYAGLGGSLSGHLNDEDWLAAPGGGIFPYSSTLSQVHSGIDYGTIDLGYDVFRGSGYKVGVFAGYNYLHQLMNAYGCVQLANTTAVCVPTFPPSVLGIIEEDRWQSLRLGAAGDFMLTPHLKLGAEVAYLPYVGYDAVDHHVLGSRVFPASGHGDGVQLESILSYFVTEQFTLGVGGRYWAMRTTDAQRYEMVGNVVTPPTSFRAAVEQAGLFAQAAYRFGTP